MPIINIFIKITTTMKKGNTNIQQQLPTKWSKTEEIETFVGGNTGGRAKLIVTHYCGDSKKELIGQLETLIYGLKNGFNDFGM